MTPREKRFIDEKFAGEGERLAAYQRLDAGEPLAYILGEWYFWDGVFKLNRACLIPQPDTELLVETAVRRIPRASRFADLCTGSGCVAISVLRSRPDLSADAFEISDEACAAAEENAELGGVAGRLRVVCADITDRSFAASYSGYTALLSNPPYVRTDVIATLDGEVRAEPFAALDGGEDGLRFYRVIAALRPRMLSAESTTLLEIGYDQAEAVKSIFGGGMVLRDYGGNDRVFVI